MKIIKGKQPTPRRVMFYGVHGIGKSTLAAKAGALFLDIEGGLNDIDCAKTERITTWLQFQQVIGELENESLDFPAIALDSLDWLERLAGTHICQVHGKNSLEDFDFGKGTGVLAEEFKHLLQHLEVIRSQGKTIILLAHAQIQRFNDPENDAYDRYWPAIRKQTSSLIQEWCDEVLFCQFRTFTRKEDKHFGKERTIATGSSERIMRCVETPAVVAKNRLGLPDELPLDWDAYASHFAQRNGDITGIVKDGSSKQK